MDAKHNPPPPGKILLVDDVPENLSVLSAALEPEGYEILAATSGESALKIAARARPDLILLDVMMPGMNGWTTCRELQKEAATQDIPVIFITARGGTENVVEAFRLGGVDYITKPFQAEEVISRVATHLKLSTLNRELREKNKALEERTIELSAEIARREKIEGDLKKADDHLAVFSHVEASRGNIAGLVGSSAPLRKVVQEVERLRQFPNTNVLILGESGTGKELVARAIHFDSTRAKAPFLPLNCVAIPNELAESILFGHAKGAFTGALSDQKGSFVLADGGTLFLDEIGDMAPSLQAKLLRVLEDGFVTVVGGAGPRKVNVRVIAATNADLESRIASGTFRQDLYFRLARYTIRTPPLRERIEDIHMLAKHFLQQFAAEMGQPSPGLTVDALSALETWDFPGNIRELRNLLERALIDSGGEPIQRVHLRFPEPKTKSAFAEQAARPEGGALPMRVAEAEDALIQRALAETGGNIAEAARMLGIHRTRIYRRLAQQKEASPG